MTLLELGRTGKDLFVTDIAVDPHDPRRIVVSFAEYDTRNHLAGAAGGVYHSRDGGATWTLVPLAVPIFAVALDPTTPERIYAGGKDRAMYVSDDFGVTWTVFSQGLPFVSIADIQVDPHTPGVLYAATLGGGIYTFTRP